MITFKQINNSFVTISASYEVLELVTNELKYYSPGLKFSNPRSNGYISLFSKRDKKISIGLLGVVISAIKSKYPKEDILLCKNIKNSIKPIEVNEDFINSLKLPFTPRKYQIDAFLKILNQKRVVIESPTSSGKTLIIYMLLRFLQQNSKVNVLILVPNNMLQSQIISDCFDYGWREVENFISLDKKSENHNIICTTWQALQKELQHNSEYFNKFQIVIVDEAHKASAFVLKSIIESTENAFIKVGFTGTLSENDASRAIIRGLFGKSYVATTNSEMIELDIIPKLIINIIELKYPEVIKLNYDKECEYIQNSYKRKRFLRKLLNKIDGNSIVIGINTEYLREIKEIVLNDKKKMCYYMDGETNINIRMSILEEMESDNNKLLFGSYGLLQAGISVKNVKNLVFIQSRKSYVAIRQSIGRILRKHPDIQTVKVYDIVDDLKYTKIHSLSRINIYETEQLDYRFNEVLL